MKEKNYIKPIHYYCLSIIFILLTHLSSGQKWVHPPYLNKSFDSSTFYEIQSAFNKYYSTLENKKVKGTGFKQFKRWEWRNKSHAYPTGIIPSEYYYVKQYLKFVDENQANLKSQYDGNWFLLGFNNWQEFHDGGNPGNGRLNAVVVNPNNKNIIFVASPSGGVWKSTDGGLTWNTSFDYLSRIGTSSIAIHPNNSNIIYAGTGDRDGFDCQTIGLLKSIDGGSTWQTTGFTLSPQYNSVNKIIINPLNPNTMLIATNNGIYKSVNGGNSWTKKSSIETRNIQFMANDTNIILASGYNFIKSVNAGNNFSIVNISANASRIEFDISPLNNNVVYAIASNYNSTFEGFYKSVDGGNSFTQQSNSPNILGYEADGSDDMGQGWYDLAIACSPSNVNEVYIGGVNIWKTLDGGQTWNICTEWYTGSGYPYIHCDIHYIDFFGDTLYVASDGGVFYTPNHANSWIDISSGLGISQFYSFTDSETEPSMIVGGTQDNGTNMLHNNNWYHIMGGDGMESLIDENNTDILYATYYYGNILKSTDGGVSFDYITPTDAGEGDWVTPFVMSEYNTENIIGGYSMVYKTINGGSSWNAISDSLSHGNTISNLAMGGINDEHIYASSASSLFATHNGGLTWDNVFEDLDYSITCICLDNNNPLRIWMTISSYSGGKVMYSSNGGLNFNDITGNLTNLGFNCITYDGNSNNGLYLGTETGVFYRNDSINNWIAFNHNLPIVSVTKLKINNTLKVLRASTYGRGIWETSLYGTIGINNSNHYDFFSVYPNPTSDIINIKCNYINEKNVNILIYNYCGQIVKRYTDNIKPDQIVTISIDDLMSSTYYIKIVNQNINYSFSFVKIAK